MHRKSMEVAQHYSEAEAKLNDNVVTSSGSNAGRGDGNGGGHDGDSSSSAAAAAAAALHHQQQRAHQHLQRQLHNLSNAQQNSLYDAATAALGVDHSEDFRSSSIASLRAKAQQHSAKLIQSAYSSPNLDHHLHDQNHQQHPHSHHKIGNGASNPLQVTL